MANTVSEHTGTLSPFHFFFRSTSKGVSARKRHTNKDQMFLENFANKFGIKDPEDWYKVSAQQLRSEGGGVMLDQHKDMYNLLKAFYPNFQWELWRFKREVHPLDPPSLSLR
jgi:hypothetical protein